MPRTLFYIGTASCLFVALSAAASLAGQLDGAPASFLAVHAHEVGGGAAAVWAMMIALLAAMGMAAILVRMAALLAARNLFGAFLALFSVGATVVSLTGVVLLQSRMLVLVRRHGTPGADLSEMHFAAVLTLAYFIGLSLLALRPYFRIQTSRLLSGLVLVPLPLFFLMLIHEVFMTTPPALLPAATPASFAFLGMVAVLAFAIAVHCVRHRHMFLEMTNLRELLQPRVDRTPRPLAFDA